MERIDQIIEHVKLLHAGQTDKTGLPYWHHCTRVANACVTLSHVAGIGTSPDEARTIAMVSLLHDIIEDVPDGEERLKGILAPDELDAVVPSLRLLTKSDGMSYGDYVERIMASGDHVALLVKFAVMIDHVERLPLVKDERTRKRLQEKYREPYRLLRLKFLEMAGAEMPCQPIFVPVQGMVRKRLSRRNKSWRCW